MSAWDAIVIGAGAAGLFCAGIAGQRGKRVLVLEKAEKPGKKILISGGGRCNFTNINVDGARAAERFLSANPHFAKSALSRYPAREFLALVERHGIAWHEKTLGQLFCDGSARQIVGMLLAECAAAEAAGGEVLVRCEQAVETATRENDIFSVTANGETHTARNLVIACGGPSIPKMGASDFGYRLGRQFGLKIVEPRPALVPLTLGGEDVLFRELSGVAAPVHAQADKTRFAEAALFTHRGLSGPAILQVSSYWKAGEPVSIDFLPEHPEGWLIEAKAANPRATLLGVLREHLPDRLAATLAERIGIAGDLSNVPDRSLRRAEEQLSRWTFTPSGTEGYAKAEVTAGGISTAALSSQTMEAKAVPGLYAVGEAVDVTGWLGGYNFQWAWASGYAAGQAIA